MSREQFRLSPQQKRVYSLQRHGRGFRSQAVCLIEGELEFERLREAVRRVVEAHEAFRLRLRAVTGLKTPGQEIVDDATWCESAPAEGSADLLATGDYYALLAEAQAHDHEGDDGPPLRLTFSSLGGSRHVMLVSSSALWADLWTLRNFVSELARELDPAPPLAEPPIQYVDYVVWRNDLYEQDDDLAAEGRAFWRQQLDQQTLACRLPAQSPAALPADFTPRHVPVRLSAEVAGRLASLARQQGESLESMLFAAWAALLHRLTDAPDLTVGVMFDGRPHEDLRGSMGPYAQVVPVTLRGAFGGTFDALLGAAGEALRQAGLWQDYFQWPEAAAGDVQFCPFGFTWHPPAPAAGLMLTIVAESSLADRFELQLACTADDAGVNALLNYDPACLSPAQVERLARRFERLCLAVSTQIDAQLPQLPVLTAEDERQLLVDWNRTEDDGFVPRCLHHCFEEQVERTPDAVAVSCGAQRLTYRELNHRANVLARRLRAAGVGPETPVCLFIGRSVELLVGLWGILKAGGAYVPLDTAYPMPDRIAHVIRDTGAPLILTHERLRQYLPAEPCQAIFLDDDTLAAGDGQNLSESCRPDNLAYIIYTSGSTGQPKGVMIEHASAVNLWLALRRAVYDGLPQRPYKATLNAPVSFDASIKQLLLLLGGHALYIPSDEIRTDPFSFVTYLRTNQVEILDCTPSHLRPLLDAGLLDDAGAAPSVVLVGGEAVDPVLWERLTLKPTTRVYNVYGPTECTGDSTACPVSPGCERPLIGGPLANTQAYVLGADLQLQPPGAPGELHIGGVGLARGYWRQPALTAQRFVPHPFDARRGARLYKTGDIVRQAADGRIEYVGRRDRQIKIRGFRVELGEIASALSAHPSVGKAVVTTRTDSSQDSRLVAYVVPAFSFDPTPDELRRHLAARLPDYMAPSAFVKLDALPLTPNGKVNYKALPAPDELAAEARADYQPPTSRVEIALTDIWQEVLGVKQIGVHDNFFKLGGHSLLAMQVIARVRKEFEIDIPIPRLFQLPTIEGLAQAVESAREAAESVPAHALVLPDENQPGEPLTLSLSQQSAVE